MSTAKCFQDMAKRIAEDPDGIWFICVHLPSKEMDIFEQIYKPKNKHSGQAWMSDNGPDYREENKHRIIALLFAAELIKEGE